jgi:hypothetical protein
VTAYHMWTRLWFLPIALLPWLVLLGAAHYAQKTWALATATIWLLLAPLLLLPVLWLASTFLRVWVARRVYPYNLGAQSCANFRSSAGLSTAKIERLRVITMATLSAVSIGLYLNWSVDSALPFAVYATTAVLTVFTRRAMPPIVAYFATTKRERLDFLERLQRRVPGTVAAMLVVEAGFNHAEPLSVNLRRLLLVQFDKRRAQDCEWISEARSLMTNCAWIVLDTRDTSDAVLLELQEVFRSKLHAKSILISDDNGQCPAVELLRQRGEEVPVPLTFLTEADALRHFRLEAFVAKAPAGSRRETDA